MPTTNPRHRRDDGRHRGVGGADVLVNNAGVQQTFSLAEATPGALGRAWQQPRCSYRQPARRKQPSRRTSGRAEIGMLALWLRETLAATT
jgi:hypothetical protein